MNAIRAWQSTVGKKLVMGLSGLLLVGYLIIHLAANLTLFIPDGGRTLNLYAHTLEKLGPLLTVLRILLAIFFLSHIISGIRVIAQNAKARGRYAVRATKGGPSRMNMASLWMARTGITLLIFVPIHIWMFSLGTYYETVIDGTPMRDLARLVIEQFSKPVTVAAYVAVMLLLWLHLRHGFWSAFQSLGALSPRWAGTVHAIGLFFAIALAGGFLVLPIYVYFFLAPAQVALLGGVAS